MSNPFALPSDDEIFIMREAEREEKERAKEAVRKQKVWEKTTSSSRIGRTRKIDESEIPESSAIVARQARHARGLVTAATAAISNERRREKENMADFIAKKREMFLVQMSLDTKREEIQKLERKAHMKEEALKKSELLLEEDAIRFDAFLKENDKMAHEALKNAEREAKAKTDKLHEIKKLKHAISIVEGEKSKLKEALDDCERYRKFLTSLTPPEWIEKQKAKKAKAREERRQARFAAKLRRWEADKAALEEEIAKKDEEEKRRALKEGRMYKKKDRGPLDLRPAPRLEDAPFDDEEEEIPMYFTRPQQLLDIFTHLEESNLFLIQNCQETEQQLEELKQQYRETEHAMTKQTQALSESIRQLKEQIAKEEAKNAQLRLRVKQSTVDDPQEKLLQALNERVLEVYEKCGFDPGANPTTLSMLAALEGRLEKLLTALASMSEDYVTQKEKEKEKDRRDRVRADRILAQKEAYAQRLQISMARSQAPVKKKTGKPVMFRSAPIKRKVKKEKIDPKKLQEMRDMKFLT